MKRINNLILSSLTLTFISGCGGGGGGGGGGTSGQTTVTSPPAKTYKVESIEDASSFLTRATFGSNTNNIESLLIKEDYKKWIDDQFTKSPNYHLEWAKLNAKGVGSTSDLKDTPEDWVNHSDALSQLQRDAWWDIVVFGDDQLRQRVAFALSEIMVISKFGQLINYPDMRMSYYDVLVKNAFANFETLLQEVTYHPAMGRYLSYLGNSKADPLKGTHPDENYAREVMQLFTIGLYELNIDGSKKLNNGKTLATYTQDDIKEMSKVFTGLTDDNNFFLSYEGFSSHKIRTEAMIASESYHDKSEKQILGKTIPAGGNTKTDINLALNHLFNHNNTGPFIAKRLIQRLITSNPSPEYIKHVALAFNDNGKGVRGDMKAVIKAILLYDVDTNSTTFGKLREPLLFISHLFRAFNVQKAENILYQGSEQLYKYTSLNFNGTGYTQQEGALEALTVFNYFTPEDGPYSLKKEGLIAPEFQLLDTKKVHQLLMGLINKDSFIYDTFNISAELQLENEKTLLDEKKYDELLDKIDLLLLGGKMNTITRSAIKNYINSNTNLSSDTLARYVISLVITSPDFAIQR